MRRDTLLFLGSGATVGSGTTRLGHALPADDFFGAPIVQALLAKGGYPALTLLRKHVPALHHTSLFVTWNNLYIQRALTRSGILREPPELIAEGDTLKRYRWPRDYIHQAAHYRHFFAIRALEAEDGREADRGHAISELALWDLRLLILELYGAGPGLKERRAVYRRFWRPLAARTRAVVNFNYDTTFDRAVTAQAATVFHPHGSLEWLTEGRWSRREGGGGWSDWKEYRDRVVRASDMGFRPQGEGQWTLRQPLMVPPPVFKEEIIGGGRENRLGGLLREQWEGLAREASAAKRWVFVGFSFSSGDEHLIYLLKRLYRDQEICCSFYDPLEMPSNQSIFGKLLEVAAYRIRLCVHPIRPGATIDSFFEKAACPLSTAVNGPRSGTRSRAAIRRPSK